jgi:hypothetical protein
VSWAFTGSPSSTGLAPERTLRWLTHCGLVVAGFHATADGLAETDVRLAYFGDLVRRKGAMVGDESP